MKYYDSLQLCFPLAAEAAALACLCVVEEFNCQHSTCQRRPCRRRARRDVLQIYDCLGPVYFRRAYRMDYRTFWVLHDKLQKNIVKYRNILRRRSTREEGFHGRG